MASYTQLPEDWQTALEDPCGCAYHLDLVLDPDGRSIVIGGVNGIRRLSRISNVREPDPRWAGRSVLPDVQVDIHDPDGSLAPLSPGSPLHCVKSELAENCESATNELHLEHREGSVFVTGERVTILGENYFYGQVVSGEYTVESFTPGTGTDTLILAEPLTQHYLQGAIVYTVAMENTQVQIRLHVRGAEHHQVLYRGRIQQVRTLSGMVRLVLADLKKQVLDRQLVGADGEAEQKLLCIDQDGMMEPSITWNDGAAGSLDRLGVYVLDECRTGQWCLDFNDSTKFTLSGSGVNGRAGDIRYGFKGRLDGGDLGFTWHLAKYLDFLFIPVIDSGKLVIVNVSNPAAPVQTSSIQFGDIPLYASVVVNSNYVYVPYVDFDGSFTGYLKCFYVGNKDNPVLIDTKTAGLEGVPADFYAYSCKRYGSYLFVQGNIDIFVFNIADPWDIQYVTRFGGAGAPYYMNGLWEFTISGHYLLTVSAFDKRLVIIDIQNPQSPVLESTLVIGGRGCNVVVVGVHAVVKCTDGALYIVDISDPSQPVLVNEAGRAGSPWFTGGYGLTVQDNRLYSVSQINDALTIMDGSDLPEIRLLECIRGEESPFYLGMPYDVVVDGEFAYIAAENGLTIYRINPGGNTIQGCGQVCITPAAWGGHIYAGDRVSFKTGRTWSDANPVSVLYELLIRHAGIPGHLVAASGFFGRARIGTLAANLYPGQTQVEIAVTTPVWIKSGSCLVIDGHEYPITTGNTVMESYPPVVTLTVSNDASATMPAGTPVYRDATENPDPDYNFDREYIRCRDEGLLISLSLERDMTVLQAMECVTAHFNGFTYTDNWGVERICSYRTVDDPAIPVDGSVNLLPNPDIDSRELVNGFDLRYRYLYGDNDYGAVTGYPDEVNINFSAIRHNLERRVKLSLPGFYNGEGPQLLAAELHRLWGDGLNMITCRMNMQGLAIDIGDVLYVTSAYPPFDRYMRVTGKQFVFNDGLEVVLEGYDVTGEREEAP